MTKNQIIEYLTAGGYICHTDYEQTATVYNAAGQIVGACPVAVMDRIAKVEGLTKWREEWGGVYVGRSLGKRHSNYENTRHCRLIAEELEKYANGLVYRCPECGEIITAPEEAEKYRCSCGFVGELDEYEQQNMWDFFTDCLDIEYRCSSSKEYRSVQIMVACGGPNIYIDTASNKVELYWWGDRADWPLSYDTISAVDEWAEEYWGIV